MTISQELARLCVVRGDFTLHSGEKSDWIFDFGRAWGVPKLRRKSLWLTPVDTSQLIVFGIPAGIEFWGALEVSRARSHIIIRKDGSVWRRIHKDEDYLRSAVYLFDDVVTTGSSMTKAEATLSKLGHHVVARSCILNRGNIPGIDSVVSMEDVEEVLRNG